MLYFDHDTSAMGDPKITALCIEHGPGAVAAYWCVLEQIYREETALVIFGNQGGSGAATNAVTKVVSHWLCTDPETVEKWFSAMLDLGLLERGAENPGAVTSERAMRNIAEYCEKRETARRNGRSGGRKPTRKPNANQSETKSVSDCKPTPKPGAKLIKEKKGLGLDKLNQDRFAPCGAAAAEAAPPAATEKPLCPLCATPMWRNRQTGRWECDSCHDSFDDSKAVRR